MMSRAANCMCMMLHGSLGPTPYALEPREIPWNSGNSAGPVRSGRRCCHSCECRQQSKSTLGELFSIKNEEYSSTMSQNKDLIRLCSCKKRMQPSLDMARDLISGGADIHSKDNNGLTSFHWCCKTDKAEIAKLLVNMGSDINSRDIDGRTPLHFPCHSGFVEIVSLLLEKGADVNCRSNSGRTPLHKACSNGQTEIVKMLLDKDADVNSKDNSGRTALHWSCLNGHVEIFRLLVLKGANIHDTNDYGWTPLHKACYNGHKQICLMLVSSGADTDCKDNDGDSPLDIVESTDLKVEILAASQRYHSWQRRKNFMIYLRLQYYAIIDQTTGEPTATPVDTQLFPALKPVDEVMILLHRHIVSFI